MSGFDVVRSYFDREEWEYEAAEGEAILGMRFAGDSGTWSCLAYVDEERSIFSFSSLCPVNVPAERIRTLVEFVTLANHDLGIGAFEIDMETGEVCFRVGIDYLGFDLTAPIVERVIRRSVSTMDVYLPGIEGIVEKGGDPRDVLSRIEA